MQTAFKFSKTPSEIYAQQDRLFRLTMARATRRARKAHPETGGNHCLVINWGNDAAKAALAEADALWSRLRVACRTSYDRAEHQRHGKDFRPLWCKHCTRKG
jgi:hypothetical protein